MEYVQMIRVSGGTYSPNLATLGSIVDNNPGSLWLIGNEPDCIWQDNSLPSEYAAVYHELYGFIKSRDPSAQVAIGGIVQPTPLRLEYLDMVWDAYQSLYGEMMPVDVWNIHNMILREEKGSWGCEIPPGIDADQGMLYDVQDNDDIEIFQQQIVAFRQWMKEKGERDKPLIVSEYGVLMPEVYGFDYARVKAFMYASFDYFTTATDDSLGYPADENRLVQRWAWYSLNDDDFEGWPSSHHLFDPETQQITQLGIDYGDYIQSLTSGIAGKAYLQGHSEHSGVTITVGETGKQGESAADGSYAVADVPPGTYVLTATMPCYLYARRENVTVEEDTITTLPDVTLLSGDAKNDGVVDIFDLVIVGSNFGKSVPPGDSRADINSDGIVDIFDLVLVGTNFTKTAPGPWP
jgi:hypothetical protein